jgi:hypothetical protein
MAMPITSSLLLEKAASRTIAVQASICIGFSDRFLEYSGQSFTAEVAPQISTSCFKVFGVPAVWYPIIRFYFTAGVAKEPKGDKVKQPALALG